MKFDLTTFLFQIVNFIVLLFILKRLLYKPVREIIEKRRAAIDKTVQDAEKTRQDALELREKYGEEMARLKDLRAQTLERLQEEAMEEKKRLLGRAEEEAGRVIERDKAIFDAEKKRLQAELKDEAIDTACVMAENLLKDLSDEDIHRAVYRRLLKGLEEIAKDLSGMGGKDEEIRVEIASAYPLGGEELEKFGATLESLLSRKVAVDTAIDENLIAGARIKAYDKVYNFSLSGQVDLFRK
ncbi:MAG: F0F1 ATP synthase subunit delta, partial [Candidatus Sulfobium sp.]